MQVTIDGAGRIVVPKPIRESLGISPGSLLDLEIVEDHVELSLRGKQPTVVQGSHGPVVASTGTSISDEDVRAALEAARERR